MADETDSDNYNPEYQEVPLEQATTDENSDTLSAQQLSEVDPDWQTDGMGIRGPQPDDTPQAKLKPWDVSFETTQGEAAGGSEGGPKFSVQGDSGFVDNVNHIQFTVADDPSAGYIEVIEDSPGVAIVKIPVIPVSPGGVAVLGDDNGATYWFPTSTCG